MFEQSARISLSQGFLGLLDFQLPTLPVENVNFFWFHTLNFTLISLSSSPQTTHTVLIKNYIIADDGQILRLRLRDEHTIKWGLVRTGKKPSSDPVRGCDCEYLEPPAAERIFEIGNKIEG